MASVSTLSFLKSRLYAKSRLFNVKFHFGHKILFLKSRLYVKSRFVKSRLYCTTKVNSTLTKSNARLFCPTLCKVKLNSTSVSRSVVLVDDIG